MLSVVDVTVDLTQEKGGPTACSTRCFPPGPTHVQFPNPRFLFAMYVLLLLYCLVAFLNNSA